jgi:hypothetical protein
MRLLMNIYRYVPSIRDSLYTLGCYRLAELHIVESSLGYILIHRLRTYKMHNQNQVSKQKYWAFYLISWMGFKRNDQAKIYNYMTFSTHVLKVTFKQIYFEHVGEIHHYINWNLHSITKLLVDYFFDALTKMHNSFIQPIRYHISKTQQILWIKEQSIRCIMHSIFPSLESSKHITTAQLCTCQLICIHYSVTRLCLNNKFK